MEKDDMDKDETIKPEVPEPEKIVPAPRLDGDAVPTIKDDMEIPETDFKPGSVQPRELIHEMQESYLDYAMSVIVSRALPDVRDGLKPVHRRILYAMWSTGLKSNVKYRKCASVVGEVMKSYHPHGDIAIYDTMVRMAQNFSMRYMLVDGQGNFGSIDGDSAAAMRYTEARMGKIAEELLFDIEKKTVDFQDNYDASTQEPTVLPARLPNLLLNGSLGIAVGMATNIPPHNLTELCDASIKIIEDPEVSVEALMDIIKGPDFPTGGIIYDKKAINQAYITGKGSIVMRAVANIEEHKNSFRIIVSELPYQVNKSDLLQKIAELVKTKRIEGISDLRDESDRKDGVRIVVELKNNAFPKKILNQLFDMTPLQGTFHVNLVALVDGIQPRLLNVKNVLEEFIKHRQVVITRRTQYELKKAEDRLHILEGLKIALDHIDAIISTIRASETKEIAHGALMEQFKLSDLQASAILEMRLSALAGLERKKVEDEIEEKLALIKKLQAILADPKIILAMIKADLEEIKRLYGDARRTKVIKTEIGKFSLEDLVPNEQVIVSLTRSNYIKRVSIDAYKSQQRGGKGIIGMDTKETDVVDHIITTQTHNNIYFFTDRGRIFSAKVYDLPAVARTARGQSLMNIIQLAPEEKVTSLIVLDPNDMASKKYFFMATKNGVVKKTEIEAYKNIRQTGIIAINLNAGDVLKFVKTTSSKTNLLIVTKLGQAIYFDENDVRPMGRSAAGVRGIKLKAGDETISCDTVEQDGQEADLLTVLANGFGKRTTISKHFHTQNRGGMGVRASKTSPKTGAVIEAIVTYGEEGDIIMSSQLGQLIRLPLKSVKRLGRDTMGVTLMRLNSKDKVSSVAIVVENEAETLDAETTGSTDTVSEIEEEIIVGDQEPVDVMPGKIEAKDDAEVKAVVAAEAKTAPKAAIKKPDTKKVETDKVNLKKTEDKKEESPKEDTNYWGGTADKTEK